MDFEKAKNILSAIVSEETDIENIQLDRNTTAMDIDGWDSLAHSRIIMAFERSCNVRLPDEKLFDLENVGELIDEVLIALNHQSEQ